MLNGDSDAYLCHIERLTTIWRRLQYQVKLRVSVVYRRLGQTWQIWRNSSR